MKFNRLKSCFKSSAKNNSASRTIEALSMSSNSGYKSWLGRVKSMSRRFSHCPTKFFVKLLRPRIIEHSLDLGVERFRIGEFALFGELQKLFIGHRAPQEIRQPAGEGEVVELAGLFLEEQKLRRDHHRQQPHADRLLERLLFIEFGLDEFDERFDFLRPSPAGERPVPRTAGESAGHRRRGSSDATSTRSRWL